MRLPNVLVGALLLAVVPGCGDAGEDRGAGACALPGVPAVPAEVRAGDEVTVAVTGQFECNDGDPSGPEPEGPLDEVFVHFLQAPGNPETVDDVTATGTTYDGTVVVTVPDHAEPGPAVIDVGGRVGAAITVLP